MLEHLPRLRRLLRPVKRAVRFAVNELLDGYDSLRGARNPMVPRRNDIFVGAGDYVKTGEEFFRYFRELAGLQPTDFVLDVGCGMGRMALPLTSFLTPPGGYEGFDIVPVGIDWAQRKIATAHRNFHFQLADVHNEHYNPGGRSEPAAYRFPYPNATFDFAFLTSVFTHMKTADMEHYLDEITRVLKPGGRCLITFFLLNAESRALIGAGRSAIDFVHGAGEERHAEEDDPEAAIAFDEPFVLAMFTRRGLRVQSPVHYGSWCGRDRFLSFQDIVVAIRE